MSKARKHWPKQRHRGLPITFGKHAGALIERLVLTFPDYIGWWLEQPELLQYAYLKEHALWCIEQFDMVSLQETCHCCSNKATYLSLYRGTDDSLFPWCASCNPYSMGARGGMLESIGGYADVLWCVEGRLAKRNVVKHLAEAKGLRGRWTKEIVLTFFHGEI